ncbi:MAG TPA: PAS domain-containing sensor histidine kinase [Deltaproteobacteria bacterium]|nr:PAS domain-containing sensor histidine kinase [Deltaproteobacteria bacterium]
MKKPAPRKARTWITVSPWIIIGTVVILLPIVILMAFYSIEQQRTAMTKLLAEKGAALIRSIEAGARAGRSQTAIDLSNIQALVVETAQQPDIAHLIVTDMNGRIIAHNDPAKIGRYRGRELDLRAIAASRGLYYRRPEGRERDDIFEVFRYFSPASGRIAGTREGAIPDDVFRRTESQQPAYMIFVGLDRKPVASALKADARVTVVMALILLLIGFLGVTTLLILQGYRQTRATLSRIRTFSENLVEHIPIGVIATDASGSVTSLNQAAESILQIPASQALGRNAPDVLPAQLTSSLEKLSNGHTVIEGEISCFLPNGRSIDLDVIATSMAENGVFMGYVVIIRDLTEVKRLQNEIDRSRRLASVGRLAAGVAHEIRNPLSTIKGFATYFRDRCPDAPEDRRTAEVMIEEVDRLNRVVGQLLDFSRPVSVRSSTVSIPALVRRSLDMIEGRAREHNIIVETSLPGDNLEIDVDSDGLNQALLNLYLNAVEAMPAGGRLRVSASQDDGGVAITVADTGRGIDQENLSKIFDPYFTTKPSGTGLGLAIVHKIVEAHGGTMNVESETGRGTTVSFTIPSVEDARSRS